MRRLAGRAAPAAVAVLLATGAVRLATAQLNPNPVITTLTLFAGTTEGLWRSKDWGATWESVVRKGSKGEDPRKLGAVNVIVPLGSIVYAGGDGGLLVSPDFGESWHPLGVDGAVLAVMASRYPQSDPTVFLGTASGLFKSGDGGETFSPTALRGMPVHRIEWPGPALVLATGSGVLTSADGGVRFEGPGAGVPVGETRALALSSFYSVDPVLFAGGDRGVLRSSDGGRRWQASGLDDKRVTDLIWFGPWLYAVTDGGLFRSGDTGRSWTPLGTGLAPRVPTRLLFPLAPESGAEAFVATDDGVYRTPDGGEHWMASGLSGQRVVCVATFPPPERTGKRRR